MGYKSEIRELKKEIAKLREIILLQAERIEILEAENTALKKMLHKKNSKNSSIPPSQDVNRKKNLSLRKSSGKKVGGQKGHKGHYLKMSDSPDFIEKHIPDYCPDCFKSLEDTPMFVQKRQVIDIPPIVVQTTEHQIYSRQCSCGCKAVGKFPADATNHVSYGKRIEAMCAYFSARQYMSINRIQESFLQLANHKLSQGTISNLIKSFSKKCKPSYEEIKRRLLVSECVGTDETGCTINGRLNWVWTWQTNKLTYLTVSDNRGYKTVETNFENGLPNTILVHDCWASHFKTQAVNHQICIAHLLRELKYFIEQRIDSWSYKLYRLLLKALKLKESFGDIRYPKKVKEIKAVLNKLITTTITGTDKKLKAFKRRMVKYEHYLFTFLDYFNVPADNNASERAIRNMKVKLKVSGQFKTFQGANDFVVIRSVMDTCIKNNNQIFSALSIISALPTE